MNNMIVYWIIAFSLFGHVINSELVDVIDLVIKHKNTTIGAYPSIKNEQILKLNDTSRFGELCWFSIGHPTLISKNSSFPIANAFEIDYDGFSLQIEVLTDPQIELFKEEVKSKYGIDVKTSQIHDLIASEIKCKTEVICSNGTRLNLYGEGVNLEHNPLNVRFDAPIECFENHMIEYNKLDVDCLIRKKSKHVNTFNITWDQMSKSNLLNKLFGNASEVYVTRQQLIELASEIYRLTNVYEDYRLNLREFSLRFINVLIYKMVVDFEPVPLLDSVLRSLSKYSMKDLYLSNIKKNLSKVLKVKTIGNRKYIIAHSKYSKSNWEGCVFNASDSFNYVKEKEQSWANSRKSLDDQLKELNSHSQDNIEWELEGEKIVPKSLKVSRLFKRSFNGKLTFERINRIFDHYIDMEFSLKYENDALYKRIANKSIETLNSSIMLKSFRTKTLIKCIEACEDNQICHYAEFSDKTCSLYKKTANLFFKVQSENKQRLYEKNIIN